MKSIPEKYFALIPVALTCLFYLWRAVDFPMHDFANYYFGGKFLSNGNFTSQVYFPYWFNSHIASLGHQGIFASFAPNSPALAMVFCPLSMLSAATAKIVFNLISIAAFIFSLARLTDHYKIRTVYLLLIPIVFLVPIKNNLLFGQLYFLLFFLLAEAWIAYENGRFLKMSVFLGLAIVLKIFPIIFILILLFKRQYKPLIYIFCCVLLLVGISLLFTGLNVWLFYLDHVLPKAFNGEISGEFVTHYQSAFMFLKELFVYDSVLNPNAVFDSPIAFHALMASFKLFLIGVGFYVARQHGDSFLGFGYWVVCAILISPYGSTYTFILLLFPLFALLRAEIPVWKKATGCVLVFLICNMPVSYLLDLRFPFSYLRLMLLLFLLVLLISVVNKSVNFKIVALATLISLGLVLSFKQPEKSDAQYLLGKNAPNLIFDYTFSNNVLTYYYWNESGKNTASIQIPGEMTHADLIGNQIYYFGKKLTADDSHKIKPIVIGKNTLIYLTDYERGIGFYTLRKVTFK